MLLIMEPALQVLEHFTQNKAFKVKTKSHLKFSRRAGEMTAPWVKKLAAKHDDPDLIPKSYMVEREKLHSSPLLSARTHTKCCFFL